MGMKPIADLEKYPKLGNRRSLNIVMIDVMFFKDPGIFKISLLPIKKIF